MPGDWIKVRTNLWDDPRVASVCVALDIGEAPVIGGLIRLWSLADEHTQDGFIPKATAAILDRKVGIKGFSEAVAESGWLEFTPEGAVLPRFQEHNGKTAKRRLLDSRRKRSASEAEPERNGSGSHAEETRTKSESENKKENKSSKEPPLPPEGGAPSAKRSDWTAEEVEAGRAVLTAWNNLPDVTHAVAKLSDSRRKALRTRLRDAFWREHWGQAIAKIEASPFCRGQNDRNWRATLDWFLKPNTVARLIEGQYDGHARAGPRGKDLMDGHRKFASLLEHANGPEAVQQPDDGIGPVDRPRLLG